MNKLLLEYKNDAAGVTISLYKAGEPEKDRKNDNYIVFVWREINLPCDLSRGTHSVFKTINKAVEYYDGLTFIFGADLTPETKKENIKKAKLQELKTA